MSLGQGESRSQYFVTISNYTTSGQTFALATTDFGTLNDSGGVAFLGASSSSFAKEHGLAGWMKLDRTQVTIPAGGSAKVGVTIENSPSLTPGGHYGAILATAQTAPESATKGSRVGVLEVLSSLILLDKAGGPMPTLKLINQSTNGNVFALPTQIVDRFLDQGDVHVVPRGVVSITDPLGRQVVRGSMNLNSNAILPDTYRNIQTDLIQTGGAWMPGLYTVTTIYHFDGSTASKSFTNLIVYSGSPWVWLGAAAAVLLIAAIAWWFVLRKRQ